MSDTTLEDVEATVAAQTTETDAIMALVNGINTLVSEALYSEPISPAGNNRMRRIFDGLKAKQAEISDAVLANTPSGKAGAIVTAVNITADANPATAGKPVMLTATITAETAAVPGTPTPATPAPASGSVKFLDGTTEIGTGTVDKSGKATYSQTFIAGTYPITAIYSGDASNAEATSSVLTLTVS